MNDGMGNSVNIRPKITKFVKYLEQKLVAVLLVRFVVERQQGHGDRGLALWRYCAMVWSDIIPKFWTLG